MMKNGSWKSIAKSWVGIIAACAAVVAAVWLLSVHIHARIVIPVEKAYVDELKEKARTDSEIQKILQPELDRQHQSAVSRRNVYNRGGLLLLVMAGVFLAWCQWLRPGQGEWRGVPAWLLKYLDRGVADAPVIEAPAPAEEYCQLGQRDCKRYVRKGPCDLPECPITVSERKKAGIGAVVMPYEFHPLDEKIYGRLSAISVSRQLADFSPARQAARDNGNGNRRMPETLPVERAPIPAEERVEIRIGLGSCGIASGAQEVRVALEEVVASLGGGATVKPVGCNGLCHSEPLIEVVENGHRAMYGKVALEDVRKVVRRHLKPRGLARKVREGIRDVRARLLEDSAWSPLAERTIGATQDLEKQRRIVLENCGEIDPLSLQEYRRRKGMRAIEECLQHLSAEDVIARVHAAGLRNRDGAGLLTADQWETARSAAGPVKCIICAGDDGDPGSFTDRALLESDPFRVIEGVAIAAYAIGAREGFLLVRPEYTLALRTIRTAIALAEKQGFLGEHILGGPFRFTLHVRESSGAFTDSDDLAPAERTEGEPGGPTPQPSPAQSGFTGRTVLAGNVETLACLPWILREGSEAFAALGTEKSKGTKVFSLAGKVSRGGLIEVPMGITLREIVEEIGGGIKGGGKFKAVLIGGPAGGCIPARLAGTRVDYEELAAAGASMGSGGLIVLDDRNCAVDIARYFLHFFMHHVQKGANGCCTSCQEGVKHLLELLERICDGKGKTGDLKALEDISSQVRKECSCRLGQSASNPVMTTLQYFREEYEAHIRERRCPAAACKSLIHYRVLDNCTGCTLCAQVCPVAAIQAQPYQIHKIADDLCTRCDLCVPACPENAIEVA